MAKAPTRWPQDLLVVEDQSEHRMAIDAVLDAVKIHNLQHVIRVHGMDKKEGICDNDATARVLTGELSEATRGDHAGLSVIIVDLQIFKLPGPHVLPPNHEHGLSLLKWLAEERAEAPEKGAFREWGGVNPPRPYLIVLTSMDARVRKQARKYCEKVIAKDEGWEAALLKELRKAGIPIPPDATA